MHVHATEAWQLLLEAIKREADDLQEERLQRPTLERCINICSFHKSSPLSGCLTTIISAKTFLMGFKMEPFLVGTVSSAMLFVVSTCPSELQLEFIPIKYAQLDKRSQKLKLIRTQNAENSVEKIICQNTKYNCVICLIWFFELDSLSLKFAVTARMTACWIHLNHFRIICRGGN